MPSAYDLGGVPVKVLFAPDHTPELEIMKQMLKVDRPEIDFAIFTFAGSSGIDDVMLALARGRHDDQGRARPWPRRQNWAAPRTGQRTEHRALLPRRRRGFADLRKLHHKLMVIDERIVVAGSFNYTAAGQRVQRREHLRHRLVAYLTLHAMSALVYRG